MNRYCNLRLTLFLLAFVVWGSSAEVLGQRDNGQPSGMRMKSQASYYASVRYVIVYNDIYDLEPQERRIAVLMEPEQFGEENLKTVFDLIKERFPTPIRLSVTVHTSLATIETPEEAEMARDAVDSRFSDHKTRFKSAYFLRDEKGEKFKYTTSLHPYTTTWANPHK
jgi:hypothetical protein